MRTDEALILSLGASILRDEMVKVLWRGGNHVAVKTLVEDFATFLYLPRLAGPEVLLNAIRNGVSSLTWATDTFALAESYDEAAGRYRGLRAAQHVSIVTDSTDLLVRPEVAKPQLDAEREAAARPTGQPNEGTPPVIGGGSPGSSGVGGGSGPAPTPPPKLAKRYFGTVELDAQRVGRDAADIANELIVHLVALEGAKVRVTMEIEADLPNGANDQVVRIVTENGKQLKFTSQGFERE